MTIVEKMAKGARSFARGYLEVAYPFFVCMFGASVLALMDEHRWFGSFVAALSFVWALDLAASRAAARAKADTAAQFVALLTKDGKRQISVTVHRAAIDHAIQEHEG